MSATHMTSNGDSRNRCKTCHLRANCPAGVLDADQLEKFESYRGNVRILRKDQPLFRAGEQLTALYIVRSGTVKSMVTTEDGREQITGFYLPGEILGTDGIENDLYQTTALALETSSVCILPFQKLASLGAELPGLQRQLWRQASREIASHRTQVLVICHKDVDARVAGFLLSLSDRFRRIGYSAASFRLSMGRQEIGNYLGMTMETVSRVLGRIEKAGLIDKTRRQISLLDIPGLAALYLDGMPEKQAAGMPGSYGKNTPRVSGRADRRNPEVYNIAA